MRKWEPKAVHYQDLKCYDYGVVLGGFANFDSQYERITFKTGSDRLWQALELYQLGHIKKIVLSGGSGSVLEQQNKEAVFLRDFLLELKIPAQDILIDSTSRNTNENAINTKELLHDYNFDKKILLISSAFHLRRANACFLKNGFSVDIYSTDRISGPRKFVFDHLFLPSTQTLMHWELLSKEIAGYITYKIVGYL